MHAQTDRTLHARLLFVCGRLFGCYCFVKVALLHSRLKPYGVVLYSFVTVLESSRLAPHSTTSHKRRQTLTGTDAGTLTIDPFLQLANSSQILGQI